MAKGVGEKERAKHKQKQKKKKASNVLIISTAGAPPELPAKTAAPKRKTTAEKTRAEWLETESRNPYKKLKKSVLRKIDPLHHSVYIKYERNDNGKRCAGGILVRNETEYLKLRNPYSHIEFSVQLKDVLLYARKNKIEEIQAL